MDGGVIPLIVTPRLEDVFSVVPVPSVSFTSVPPKFFIIPPVFALIVVPFRVISPLFTGSVEELVMIIFVCS